MGSPWIAPEYAPQGQDASPEYAMNPECPYGIFRAGGGVPAAGRYQGGYGVFIKSDGQDHQPDDSLVQKTKDIHEIRHLNIPQNYGPSHTTPPAIQRQAV